jgi:hypothetical protein
MTCGQTPQVPNGSSHAKTALGHVSWVEGTGPTGSAGPGAVGRILRVKLGPRAVSRLPEQAGKAGIEAPARFIALHKVRAVCLRIIEEVKSDVEGLGCDEVPERSESSARPAERVGRTPGASCRPPSSRWMDGSHSGTG